jgi:phospholipase/carboxylesterase
MALTGPRVPPARGEATHLAVLVHGYGADGNDLIGLAPHFQRAMPTVAFVAPNAPTRLPGSPGYQWFPISRLDPHEMQKGVAVAAPVLDAFLDAELARLKLGRDRLMLIGFSQGTMLSLAVGLAKPCAAILGYSGVLTNSALPDLGPDAPPVLLVHGDQDATIPVEALLYSATALADAGARVQWHVSPGVGHGIAPDGLALGVGFLTLAMRGQLTATGPVHSRLK